MPTALQPSSITNALTLAPVEHPRAQLGVGSTHSEAGDTIHLGVYHHIPQKHRSINKQSPANAKHTAIVQKYILDTILQNDSADTTTHIIAEEEYDGRKIPPKILEKEKLAAQTHFVDYEPKNPPTNEQLLSLYRHTAVRIYLHLPRNAKRRIVLHPCGTREAIDRGLEFIKNVESVIAEKIDAIEKITDPDARERAHADAFDGLVKQHQHVVVDVREDEYVSRVIAILEAHPGENLLGVLGSAHDVLSKLHARDTRIRTVDHDKSFDALLVLGRKRFTSADAIEYAWKRVLQNRQKNTAL